jgi:hypothetical protein
MADKKLIKVVIDVAANTVEELDLTADEIAEVHAFEESKKSEQEAKDATRQSALAKLTALGLTEEEIAAL